MTKRFNKQNDPKRSETKTLSVPEQIKKNRELISSQLSGSNIKRLNNLNWLRHEISYTEPKILFHKPLNEQAGLFDYSCTKGLGDAYDYIINPEHNDITSSGICDIHYLICRETYIQPGIYRQNKKILEIYINGNRIYAPDENEIPIKIEETIFNWKNSTCPDTIRAFNLHYDLIMLQPFDDCNKRTARMIMNWALILSGYRPIVFNRKSDKENYRKAIKDMAMNNSKSYYKYMYDCMKHSQLEIIKQLKLSRIQ